ncbi:MAG TPA: YciI family protein [Candidatus Eremiobacteraceae bacterium]|nr:YciI family protein [Candidatus Eremiobacteraceae bacterium]
MRFLVTIDYTDMEARARTVDAHRAFLAAARAEGRVSESGPFVDGKGGFYVLHAADDEAAKAFIRDDPYNRDAKLRFTVRGFNSSLDASDR